MSANPPDSYVTLGDSDLRNTLKSQPLRPQDLSNQNKDLLDELDLSHSRKDQGHVDIARALGNHQSHHTDIIRHIHSQI